MRPKLHLTRRPVDALKPEDAAYDVFDDSIPGFHVRIYPSGAKAFRLKYAADGLQRVSTIGKLSETLTADKARKLATSERGAVEAGADPVAKRKHERREREEERRRAVSLSELVERWLVEGRDTAPHKRESSWDTDARLLRRHMIPLLGKVYVRELTKGDIEKAQRQIMAGKTAADEKTGFRGRAIVKGGPGAARRAVMSLSSCLSWAVEQEIIAANPCTRVKKEKPRARSRFLSEAEAGTLFDAINAMEAEGALLKVWGDTIRLLLLTGARKTEILALRWAEVDLERGLISLPRERSKTGEKHIALNNAARTILSERVREGEFVFPSPRVKGIGADGLQKAWQRVRDRAGLSEVRLHDLRHSFASFAAASGASLILIGKALGHSQSATTQRYAHLGRDPVRDMAEGIGNKIMGATSSKTPSCEVVALKK